MTYVSSDVPSYTAFLEENADFHRSVASLAGNQRLVDQISRLLDELRRVFHLGLDLRDSAEVMRAEHVALAEALIARDAPRAVDLLRGQISRSQQGVVEALLKRVGEGVTLGLAGGIQPHGGANPAAPVAD